MIHYPIPPHLQPAYSELNFNEGDFPISEKLAKEVLSLPIGLYLSETEQSKVIANIFRALWD